MYSKSIILLFNTKLKGLMDLFSTKVAYASFDAFLTNVNRLIINPLITLLFALAVIFFLYGVFQFIANQDNEEKKTAGKSHMIWGIVGLTIMLGVFAIMNMILITFDKQEINPEEGAVQLQ